MTAPTPGLAPGKPMRDALIANVGQLMAKDENIFFISADVGAPALDQIRADFKDRFINVGIAEPNMINVAAGLAMEGFTVFTYSIATFYLRAYEQIRINLALPSHLRPINVNMLALGAGISYDVSGPTHHCLEDLTVMRAMPNLMTISPSDWTMAGALAGYSGTVARPKYFRLDGKVQPTLYPRPEDIDFARGFTVLRPGKRVYLVATGIMVHQALKIAGTFANGAVGVIDVFMMDDCDAAALKQALGSCETAITMEEGFINRGGLDALVAGLITGGDLDLKLRRFGMPNAFDFTPSDRLVLHERNGFGEKQIGDAVKAALA